MTVTAFHEAVGSLRADMKSRDALVTCISALTSTPAGLADHAAREVVFLAAKRQGLTGIEIIELILSAMSHEFRTKELVTKSRECQFSLLGYEIGVQDGHPDTPDACVVDAILGEVDYGAVAGRRWLIDLVMDPSSILPPPGGPTLAWRTAQIERFVSRTREIGLAAPPVNEDKLEETYPLGISYGDAMTDVRGGDARKFSVARFRVLHKGLVYRCRFNRPEPDGCVLDGPDYVECDPRFATAPSGSIRYVAPPPSTWGFRGRSPSRPVITPFGHVVGHVSHGDMRWRIQTPYDLRSAIRAYSSAWKSGPQRSPSEFMRLVGKLGMDQWFERRPFRTESGALDERFWRCRYERFDCTLDVEFVQQEDGTWKAKLQFMFAGSSSGMPPVWVKTPRRFYEIVRDSLWIGVDGRKLYRPGEVPPWIAAMKEERPKDDGVG